MEDTGKRVFVFFCLAQYIKQITGDVELEQENVKKLASSHLQEGATASPGLSA
ncbi:MAG: hypothetical protein ABW098_09795 [Candidatus Thiodiazotropha sp.]